MFFKRPATLPTAAEALPGRAKPFETPPEHFVFHRPLVGPWPDGLEVAYVAMGCFWGVERIFWRLQGVYSTSVGYMAGLTPHPTYEEVCSGRTGHTEAVEIVFDPKVLPYAQLLKVFWENHDPTQGMRQGNDQGTQYRSGLYTRSEAQSQAATASKAAYQSALSAKGMGAITTEILPAGPYYLAEAYHQQYLAKNPNGYCGIGGTGVVCPLPTGVSA